ncbi:uncharacterized protein LOC119729570 [Patiria miniata]|uniref:Uncharacterized protein n=1 Tax=Patiria miniata TaxID=46514 RepID=A0A914A410_PATMI|nr:uncharacterized protein LOC119729570 [Patiria miniata]
MGNAYRVMLLVYGVGLMAVTASKGGAGPPRPVAPLNDQHDYICSLLPNCTTWCSDCVDRVANNLFDFLDTCDEWRNAPAMGYQYVYRCRPNQSSYVACVCTNDDSECRKCEHTEENNLVCFSQENGDVHIWPGNTDSSMLLEDMCPTCSCSTNKPTTPRPPTTPMPIPTIHFEAGIKPKPSEKSLTTDAGNTDGPDLVVIIAAAVGGGALLIAVIVGCVCYQKKCRKKDNKNGREQEYAYIDTEEMRTLRSQASMMTSQQLVSNDGIRLSCGHRNVNNEMYGLNGVGNGSTLPAQPPKLPGNHPSPANPPPAPYQELNRGRVRPADLNAAAAAAACGQCPRCGQMAAEKSATAPLLDRPATAAVDGATNPYMALIKTNTCPTPGTPSGEPMCRCHARPLSECSSVTGSVLSEPQSSHAGAVGTLDSTGQGSDQRPLSGTSDIQESPYYFKVSVPGDKNAALSPKSEQYFKLEDAETLPLDGRLEVSPMLPEADNNGNNVALKPDLSEQPPVGQGKDGYMSLPNKSSEKLDGVLPSSDVRAQTLGGTVRPEAVPEEASPIGKGSKLGSVEGLPNGDYMQLIEGQKRNDKVCGVALESTV